MTGVFFFGYFLLDKQKKVTRFSKAKNTLENKKSYRFRIRLCNRSLYRLRSAGVALRHFSRIR